MKIKLILGITAGLCIAGLLVYNVSPEPELPANAEIDSLVVYKSKKQLLAYAGGQPIKTYQISLGATPQGHKTYEGDQKTPEGRYTINAKNAKSGYHKNLGVSYPNEQDIAKAKTLGKAPGGDIKIHGLRNGLGAIHKLQRLYNWTNGCMALTNPEVDELYASVKLGTPINIKP
ncbi:L,D-transpeptidase family protein [Pedobacter sp. N36a]|uniref:L,D-transpeptidase family protein n=1 Tax=Pedobacter sp. N36a TaxID=2767996 RepID=UPI001656DAF3|nr:L,D-transpeptidase family protein [Pedobacter sp. N36a]MBC8985081.1 L,D-transpeptidase family protein [Pedobacter sp. N36a]